MSTRLLFRFFCLSFLTCIHSLSHANSLLAPAVSSRACHEKLLMVAVEMALHSDLGKSAILSYHAGNGVKETFGVRNMRVSHFFPWVDRSVQNDTLYIFTLHYFKELFMPQVSLGIRDLMDLRRLKKVLGEQLHATSEILHLSKADLMSWLHAQENGALLDIELDAGHSMLDVEEYCSESVKEVLKFLITHPSFKVIFHSYENGGVEEAT